MLARIARAFVYGLADAGETVEVNVTQNGATTSYSTVAAAPGAAGGANASWIVTLNPCSDTAHPLSVAGHALTIVTAGPPALSRRRARSLLHLIC